MDTKAMSAEKKFMMPFDGLARYLAICIHSKPVQSNGYFMTKWWVGAT